MSLTSRPATLRLAFALALVIASCGGSAERPDAPPINPARTDGGDNTGGGGGGGEGGASGGASGGRGGGGGSAGRGSNTGGRGGSSGSGGMMGGRGGSSTGGRGGSGGAGGSGGRGGSSTGGRGGGGGTGGRGGTGGAMGGRGGTGGAMGGRGGSPGTGGNPGTGGGAVADAPAGADTASGSDAPADTAPVPDSPPAGVCGNVSCPRLWQAIESCRPEGACMQQMKSPIELDRCYANGVKVRTSVGFLTATATARFVRADGSGCYLVDFPVTATPDRFAFKELTGAPIASVTRAPTGAVTVDCGAGPQPLTDVACLPPLDACPAGVCP
jgi:hypothetical protein